MKKVLKESLYWFLPLFVFSFFMLALSVIKEDFRYAHTSHMSWKSPYNWLPDFTIRKFSNYLIYLSDSRQEFLPKINFYVSEKSDKTLLSKVPLSTKFWQQAKIFSSKDNKIKNIQYRYRGDNPDNWFFEKKSIRMKYQKREMIGRQRYFEYWPLDVKILFSTNLALKTDNYASSIRLVELYVNDKSKGVFMELEKLDESFLRRKNFMPVNLYKGENYNAETKIGLDSNLYNNPGLWSKTSYFNQRLLDDKSDLEDFFKIISKSFNNKDEYSNFLTYIDLDLWSRYCAYLIISQNYHHTSWHNARLVLDPWNGFVSPIITDPDIYDYDIYDYTEEENSVFNLDHSINDMTKLLNLNPEFLDRKYYFVNNFLKDEDLINKSIKEFEEKEDLLLGSLKRDPGLSHSRPPTKLSYKDFVKHINEVKSELLSINNSLIKKIESKPKLSWKGKEGKFSLNIKSEIPASKIKFYFNDNSVEWISFDENYNGVADSSEIKYFKNKENFIEADVDLYANRAIYSKTKKFRDSTVLPSITKFDVITSNGKNPIFIKASNKFSNVEFSIKKDEKEGAQTNLLNKVLHKSIFLKNNSLKIFSGEVVIDKPIEIYEKVKILPGTVFKMKKNASLIFKNRVFAEGTESEKIKFITEKKSNEPWGTIALVGKGASGSKFDNIEFDGGSGLKHKQFQFTSMFSLHNTENIEIKNCIFKNNHFYDDTVHVVYSKKISFNNIIFDNAFGDALDVDISQDVQITDSEFTNSKNDGIDLMQSTSTIRNNFISNSKDKGISVGEGSNVHIEKNTIFKNDIGVAVKDGSEAKIIASSFSNNNYEISAYKKNWRYGSGGFVDIKKSEFKGENIRFKTLNRSSINIQDSSFEGKKIIEGNNIIIN